MNINKNTLLFNILRKIANKPDSTQRDMAKSLDISLGKLNYCLKALKEKGLIKINNFRKSKSKLGYMYLLTPRGVSQKTQLTINFMKRKLKEYDELKNELDKNKKN
tara:strand:- start:714 stop:1031 length:318 start_codon:yes stop_codon:yes gene_type:complete